MITTNYSCRIKVGRRYIRCVVDTTSDNVSTT